MMPGQVTFAIGKDKQLLIGKGTPFEGSNTLVNVMSKIANFGYHRWLSHRHVLPGVLGRTIMLYSIVCSCLVKPVHYVIAHRMHHKHSDTNEDSHSPHTLPFIALLDQKYNPYYQRVTNEELAEYAKDVPILDDWMQRNIYTGSRWYY
jgi:fatty-acid desaturase